MERREEWDVVVLGGGPAGLAAAREAGKSGARACLVEREERLGGILKQCVHEGFGLERFGERLTGPEYARREVEALIDAGLQAKLGTFVSRVRRVDDRYHLDCVSKAGLSELSAKSLVLATGCRERTDRQVFIHGDRPAGLLTAGLAQYLVNIKGLVPGHRAVILGSGDIGLIMARRFLLEGIEVEGVYELKPEPSGLSRNLQQCLSDFGTPLHLSTTVTEVHGRKRVEAVTVASVDQRGAPIKGSERLIECDCLVLSVGLIPENEIALSLGLSLDPSTKGPRVDQNGGCEQEGLYCCGNALHVNDLVDYVSDSGMLAGRAAAGHASGDGHARRLVPLKPGPGFLYAVPQFIDPAIPGAAPVYFRSNSTIRGTTRVSLRARVRSAGTDLAARAYQGLRPPEMERLEFDPSMLAPDTESLMLELERKE